MEGLCVDTDRQMESLYRMHKPPLGPGQPLERHLCRKGVFPHETLSKRLRPCDHLIAC